MSAPHCRRCSGSLLEGELCPCGGGGPVDEQGRAWATAPAVEWIRCGYCGGALENVTDFCWCQLPRERGRILALTKVQSNSADRPPLHWVEAWQILRARALSPV